MTDKDTIISILDRARLRHTYDGANGVLCVNSAYILFKPDGELDDVWGNSSSGDEEW